MLKIAIYLFKHEIKISFCICRRMTSIEFRVSLIFIGNSPEDADMMVSETLNISWKLRFLSSINE